MKRPCAARGSFEMLTAALFEMIDSCPSVSASFWILVPFPKSYTTAFIASVPGLVKLHMYMSGKVGPHSRITALLTTPFTYVSWYTTSQFFFISTTGGERGHAGKFMRSCVCEGKGDGGVECPASVQLQDWLHCKFQRHCNSLTRDSKTDNLISQIIFPVTFKASTTFGFFSSVPFSKIMPYQSIQIHVWCAKSNSKN